MVGESKLLDAVNDARRTFQKAMRQSPLNIEEGDFFDLLYGKVFRGLDNEKEKSNCI